VLLGSSLRISCQRLSQRLSGQCSWAAAYTYIMSASFVEALRSMLLGSSLHHVSVLRRGSKGCTPGNSLYIMTVSHSPLWRFSGLWSWQQPTSTVHHDNVSLSSVEALPLSVLLAAAFIMTVYPFPLAMVAAGTILHHDAWCFHSSVEALRSVLLVVSLHNGIALSNDCVLRRGSKVTKP